MKKLGVTDMVGNRLGDPPVGNLRQQADDMGRELEEQGDLLNDVDNVADRVQGKLQTGLKKVGWVIKKNEDRWSSCCIAVLIFVLILLLVMFSQAAIVLFIGIGLISWLDMARIARGQTLTIKNKEFVEAAIATGVRPLTIVLRHVVPNLLGIVVVYATLLIPEMIIYESFISFLGLGVQEPDTSLGALISGGARQILGSYTEPWQLWFPLAFFVALLFSLFFVGDGLRDALDPKDR